MLPKNSSVNDSDSENKILFSPMSAFLHSMYKQHIAPNETKRMDGV